jgi:hypothetical protein
LDNVLLRVGTGTAASITAVTVFDGNNVIELFADLNVNGTIQTRSFDLPSNPSVNFAITISMTVKFENNSANAVVRVVGAGATLI